MRHSLVAALLLVSSAASAGTGPWVLGPGEQSLYLGVDVQRFTVLRPVLADGPEIVDVDGAIQTFGGKAFVTYGLSGRVEIDVGVPVYRSEATRPDSVVCTTFGLQACNTTKGVGLIESRLKWLAVDELAGAPVSLSLGAFGRFGALTASDRARITNLGEGTTDFGPFVSVGRTGVLGQGYWSAYLEGGWNYRTPNVVTPGNKAPGSEFWASSDIFLAPTNWVAIGPSVTFLGRPFGVDFADTDLGDVDRFAALKVYNTRVGGKVVIRNEQDAALTVNFLRTVMAVNNPSDTWLLGAGVSVYGFLDKKGEQ